jgi:hypothetical protein
MVTTHNIVSKVKITSPNFVADRSHLRRDKLDRNVLSHFGLSLYGKTKLGSAPQYIG